MALLSSASKLPKTYAYIRVSTWSQDLLKDRHQLEQYVQDRNLPTPIQWEQDHESGFTPWTQRSISKIIDKAVKGDILVVTEVSRLSRDMKGMIEIMEILAEKDVPIHAVKENLIIDNSLGGQFTGKMWALVADVERKLGKSRTLNAIQARQARNLQQGRPKGIGKSKLDEHVDDIIYRIVKGETKTEIAASKKCSVNNLNTYLNKRGLNTIIEKRIKEKREAMMVK